MAPQQEQEGSPLLNSKRDDYHDGYQEMEMARESSEDVSATSSLTPSQSPSWTKLTFWQVSIVTLPAAIVISILGEHAMTQIETPGISMVPTGPYRLVEAQEGKNFFSFYDFYDGPDSLGSAGHNTYVSQSKAAETGIASIVTEKDARTGADEDFVYMSSAPTKEGPRDSVRLEGKTRFDRGLFILDVRHMPDGCGVWPAFWMTDEAAWPRNGEVDILEGVNGQTVSKTALHTSDQCDMYAHVPPWAKTGEWEWITGIPDTFTGEPDFQTSKAADNCWVMAQHQWANQGCTAIHDRDDTIGAPVNDNGGGIYALEWDPENNYMKSWVFSPEIPQNLQDAIDTAGWEDASERILPDPSSWGLPYAYFAVGEATGCSADHFKNMRLVFNLAFCGNVSGNRFSRECKPLADKFEVKNENGFSDPVLTCNAYIESNPEALEEAYWKIKGVYVYERDLEKPKKKELDHV